MNDNQSYVQFGCGLVAPDSWCNFDASPTLRIQRMPVAGDLASKVLIPRLGQSPFPENVRYGDVVKGLPIRDNSIRAIYSSHVLEHLSLHDLRQALRNIYGYLQPGGYFRFVLPDLEFFANQYLESNAPEAAMVFMERTYLGSASRPKGLFGFVRSWLGNSNHLWMWDYDSMALELEQAGFVKIRRATFGDSDEVRFHDVETKSRWDSCLGMECRKGGGIDG